MMKDLTVRKAVEEEMKQRGLSRYKSGAADRIFKQIDPDVMMSPALVDIIMNLLKGEEL